MNGLKIFLRSFLLRMARQLKPTHREHVQNRDLVLPRTVPEKDPEERGRSYFGYFTVSGKSFEAQFDVRIDDSSRPEIVVAPVNAKTYIAMSHHAGKTGQVVTEFELYGQSDDGWTFASDRVSLTGFSSSSNGFVLRVEAGEMVLSASISPPQDKPAIRLLLRGFESHVNGLFKTPLGQVSVHGDTSVPDSDTVSGVLTIQANDVDPGPSWEADAMAFLAHLRMGLQLAHGSRLAVARRDFACGEVIHATYYRGRGQPHELPIQHPMNHRPFIQALVDRYFTIGPLPDILWTALGWVQVETTYDEIRFMSAMIALEAIIEFGDLPERSGNTIPKAEFRPLRTRLAEVVNSFEPLTDAQREIFEGKISQINQRTFAEKIQALFSHYNLPLDGFDAGTIKFLIGLRNDVVHRGTYPDDDNMSPIHLAREIVTRILLNEIGFAGQYRSYYTGEEVSVLFSPQTVPPQM